MTAPEQTVGLVETIVNDHSANKYGRFMLLEAGIGLGLYAASKISRGLGMNVVANVTELAAAACTAPLAVDTVRFTGAASHAVARAGSIS